MLLLSGSKRSAAKTGGVFCMFCDYIAQTAFAPVELSISTVTALFGAPVVIAMLIRRHGGKA